MEWFRMYGDMPDDPKIGTLTDAEFRTWVEMLCAACKVGDNGRTALSDKTINWSLRRNVTETLQGLLQRELVTVNSNGEYVIKAWEKRQYKSDSSAERVAAHRKRLKEDKDLAVRNGDVTLQKRNSNAVDTDTDTDTDRKTKPSAPSEKKLSLTADGDWTEIAPQQRLLWERAYPALSLDAELAKAAAWLIANPKQKKSNYARFLTNWFSRAQDSARPAQHSASAVAKPAKFDPVAYVNRNRPRAPVLEGEVIDV